MTDRGAPDPMTGAPDLPFVVLHASCVTGPKGAVLLRGASGSGKSALALHLIALGAELVADDRTALRRSDGGLYASAPEKLPGVIEARGIGLLEVPVRFGATVRWVVDLDRAPAARLPRFASCDILDVALPLLEGRDLAHLSPALWLLMTGSTRLDPESTA